jgi:hypothetical protein
MTSLRGIFDRALDRALDRVDDELSSIGADDETEESESETEDSFVCADDDDEPDEYDFEPLSVAQVQAAAPAVFGDGQLYRAPSQIEGAGPGLFANRAYAAGDVVTLYSGELIDAATAAERAARKEATHVIQLIPRRWYIDGLRTPGGRRVADPERDLRGLGMGAYANSTNKRLADNARFDFADSERNRAIVARDACNTAELNPRRRVKYVRALTEIAPGDEILIEYGLRGS